MYIKDSRPLGHFDDITARLHLSVRHLFAFLHRLPPPAARVMLLAAVLLLMCLNCCNLFPSPDSFALDLNAKICPLAPPRILCVVYYVDRKTEICFTLLYCYGDLDESSPEGPFIDRSNTKQRKIRVSLDTIIFIVQKL